MLQIHLACTCLAAVLITHLLVALDHITAYQERLLKLYEQQQESLSKRNPNSTIRRQSQAAAAAAAASERPLSSSSTSNNRRLAADSIYGEPQQQQQYGRDYDDAHSQYSNSGRRGSSALDEQPAGAAARRSSTSSSSISNGNTAAAAPRSTSTNMAAVLSGEVLSSRASAAIAAAAAVRSVGGPVPAVTVNSAWTDAEGSQASPRRPVLRSPPRAGSGAVAGVSTGARSSSGFAASQGRIFGNGDQQQQQQQQYQQQQCDSPLSARSRGARGKGVWDDDDRGNPRGLNRAAGGASLSASAVWEESLAGGSEMLPVAPLHSSSVHSSSRHAAGYGDEVDSFMDSWQRGQQQQQQQQQSRSSRQHYSSSNAEDELEESLAASSRLIGGPPGAHSSGSGAAGSAYRPRSTGRARPLQQQQQQHYTADDGNELSLAGDSLLMYLTPSQQQAESKLSVIAETNSNLGRGGTGSASGGWSSANGGNGGADSSSAADAASSSSYHDSQARLLQRPAQQQGWDTDSNDGGDVVGDVVSDGHTSPLAKLLAASNVRGSSRPGTSSSAAAAAAVAPLSYSEDADLGQQPLLSARGSRAQTPQQQQQQQLLDDDAVLQRSLTSRGGGSRGESGGGKKRAQWQSQAGKEIAAAFAERANAQPWDNVAESQSSLAGRYEDESFEAL
jgi:hypothetical protein